MADLQPDMTVANLRAHIQQTTDTAIKYVLVDDKMQPDDATVAQLIALYNKIQSRLDDFRAKFAEEKLFTVAEDGDDEDS